MTAIGPSAGLWSFAQLLADRTELPSDTIAPVQADFAVELGADDETLELPWSDRLPACAITI